MHPESQDVGTVTIYVECVEDNACPVATDDEYGAIYGKLLVVGVADSILLNDEDDDGDSLTAELFDRAKSRHSHTESRWVLQLQACDRLHRHRHLHLQGLRRRMPLRSGNGDDPRG